MNLRSILRSVFVEPRASIAPLARAVYLILCLGITAAGVAQCESRLGLKAPFPYEPLVFAALMLLTHVAFDYVYPPAVTALLRCLSIAWAVFAFWYWWH